MKIKALEQPTTESIEVSADTFAVTENDDDSVTFPLTDGTIVTLRDPLTEDMLALEQFGLKQEALSPSMGVLKLVSLMCVKWGERDKISYEELTALPYRKAKPDLQRLGYVLSKFFRLEDLLSRD
jgi:hypothetical protein